MTPKQITNIRLIKNDQLFRLIKNNDSIGIYPFEFDTSENCKYEELFDREGRLIEKKNLSKNNNIIDQTNYIYDSNGNLITKRHATVNSFYITNLLYDRYNKLIESKNFNSDDKLIEKITYNYTEEGQLQLVQTVDDLYVKKVYYVYDDLQRLIEKKLYLLWHNSEFPEDSFESCTKYEYLENGNRTVSEFECGDQYLISQRIYNSEDLLIEEIDYKNSSSTKFFYNDSLLTEKVHSYLNSEEYFFQSMTIYIYDSGKNLIEDRLYMHQTSTVNTTYYNYVFDHKQNWIKKYTYFKHPDTEKGEIKGFYHVRELVYFE